MLTLQDQAMLALLVHAREIVPRSARNDAQVIWKVVCRCPVQEVGNNEQDAV